MSVPNGAYAVTVGAGGGKTIIVAAPVRLIPGKLIRAGDKIGAERKDAGGKQWMNEFV